MSTDKIGVREGLNYPFHMNEAQLFKRVDETGGWPVGYQYIGFEHTDERRAGFCNSPINTGMWTVVASADDYYLSKLSPAAIQRFADAVRNSLRITEVDIERLRVNNARGWPLIINNKLGPKS